MIYLLPPILLAGTAGLLVLIRWLQPTFAYHWLVATAGALTAWLVLLGLRLLLPPLAEVEIWGPAEIFTGMSAVGWDQLAWTYAMALGSLTIAALLADVGRGHTADWVSWATHLALAAFSQLIALSGTPATLLLAFGAMDLFRVGLLIGRREATQNIGPAWWGFGGRVIGAGLLLWVGLMDLTSGLHSPSDSLGLAGASVLLIAGFLRLGPILPTRSQELGEGSGIPHRAIEQLMAAVGGLVVWSRFLVPGDLEPLLWPVSMLALLAGLAWYAAPNDAHKWTYWVWGMAVFSWAAAARGQPEAALAWGAVLIFSGGILVLYRTRGPWLQVLPLLGLWGLSTLPFAPSWEGVSLFVNPLLPGLFLLVVGQAFFMAGYLVQATRPGAGMEGSERWVVLLYPLGLAVLPLGHLTVSWLPWQGLAWLEGKPLWPGFAAGVLGILVWWGGFIRLVRPLEAGLERVHLIPGYLSDILDIIIRGAQRFLEFLSGVLEGQAGMLWTLLLLTLLISILASLDLGGMGVGN